MEVLLRIWVGHATHGITDRYTVDALKRDVNLRRETAEQVGLGSSCLIWKPNCQLRPSSASRMEIWPSRVTDSEQQQLSPKELQTFRGGLRTLPTRRTR